MKMTPRLKGLRVPHWLLYVYGVLDRRLFHGASAQSTLSECGYVRDKTHAFQAYCLEAVSAMEYDLKSLRCEAAALIQEHRQLDKQLTRDSIKESSAKTIEEVREMRRAIPIRNKMLARLRAIPQRLAQIESQIRSRESQCMREVEIVKEKLKSALAAYGCGVKRAAFRQSDLPTLDGVNYFRDYTSKHLSEDDRLSRFLKGE